MTFFHGLGLFSLGMLGIIIAMFVTYFIVKRSENNSDKRKIKK
tara:strand:- start:653 stop:781 length:129 start_codon:yes stop_codon:yes gene_type:complete